MAFKPIPEFESPRAHLHCLVEAIAKVAHDPLPRKTPETASDLHKHTLGSRNPERLVDGECGWRRIGVWRLGLRGQKRPSDQRKRNWRTTHAVMRERSKARLAKIT